MTTTRSELPGKSIASLLGARPAAGPAKRLSESALWDQQREFYDGSAAGIWGTSTVPHGITGNPRIANTYARLALSFVNAVHAGRAAEGADELHFIEFGGGSGRFAYLFVRQLRELAPGLNFTYVVTDFSADRVAAWAANAGFRPLIDEGFVDFAVLDADRLGPVELVVSGRTLTPGSLRGPVVGVANYVFDTLRHDAYTIRGGELLEARIRLSDATGEGQRDGGALTDIEWETAPCEVPGDLASVFELYRDTLDDTSVLVPVGGLRCLEFLADLTSGPTCALVADKGHSTPVELCSRGEPSVVPHGNGFSLMVNFDLIARVIKERGGVAVLPREPARSLVVAAFVQDALEDPVQFESTVQDQLVDLGPDNYFTLRPLLGANGDPSIETMLASLRLSRFDPSLLIELLPRPA